MLARDDRKFQLVSRSLRRLGKLAPSTTTLACPSFIYIFIEQVPRGYYNHGKASACSLAFCPFTQNPDEPCHSPVPAQIICSTRLNMLPSPHSIQIQARGHQSLPIECNGASIGRLLSKLGDFSSPEQVSQLDITSFIGTLTGRKYLQTIRDGISPVNNGNCDMGTALLS